MLRAPTGRGRDGTAGRFDAMRDARRVSDRLGGQYRDYDGFESSVVDDRHGCRCVAFLDVRPAACRDSGAETLA
jgi:hypothetical protein